MQLAYSCHMRTESEFIETLENEKPKFYENDDGSTTVQAPLLRTVTDFPEDIFSEFSRFKIDCASTNFTAISTEDR